jgi:plastocyanin
MSGWRSLTRRYKVEAAMFKTTRRAAITMALNIPGAVLACSVLPLHAQEAAAAILIDNFTFNPQRLTVKAGTTVVWTNHDDIPHAIAAVNKQFRSKALDTDDAYSFKFIAPGIYEYFCSLHPHMTGTIVVEAPTTGDAGR